LRELAFFYFQKGETMSTITRLISLDLSSARHLLEKAARFKEAAEVETRLEIAARFYKRIAFLESEAEFYEARAKRWLDEYAAPNTASFRDFVTAMMEEQNES
jgi:hypothetical protein